MEKNVIVFYDTQNISSLDIFDKIKATISRYGNISSMRIYHDFIGKDNQWKKVCFDYGYIPCQILRPKKNTADLMITIDAMKLLTAENSIFCFVSNDSDFAPISLTLREMGKHTMLVTTNNDQILKNYFTYFESVSQIGKQDIPASVIESKNEYIKINIKKIKNKLIGMQNAKNSETFQTNALTGNNHNKFANKNSKLPDLKEKMIENNNSANNISKKEIAIIPKKDIEKYLKDLYSNAKKDDEKWAFYSSFCSMFAKRYKLTDFKAYGFNNKKDFIISCGFEIENNNIRLMQQINP